jgi:RNA exonuclease NGL2
VNNHVLFKVRDQSDALRQAIILLREIAAFRKEIGAVQWPCVITGGKYQEIYRVVTYDSPFYVDWNLPPDEITYSLLVGETVTESQYDAFNASRIIHVSIDTSIGVQETGLKEEEEDSDKWGLNCRPCNDSDGLLRVEELEDMFKRVNAILDSRQITDWVLQSLGYFATYERI